jgi:hypothetical protein
MATTNEDSTILAATHFEDGEMLMARQLSDRGTIEFAFWHPDPEHGATQKQALEVAASLDEVEALAALCGTLGQQARAESGQGGEIGQGVVLEDGARLVAFASGSAVALVRQPDAGNRIELDPQALDRLISELLPKVKEKLITLGDAVP